MSRNLLLRDEDRLARFTRRDARVAQSTEHCDHIRGRADAFRAASNHQALPMKPDPEPGSGADRAPHYPRLNP